LTAYWKGLEIIFTWAIDIGRIDEFLRPSTLELDLTMKNENVEEALFPIITVY
jgi:hypothetical protein